MSIAGRQQAAVVKEEKPRLLKLILLLKPVTSEATTETIISQFLSRINVLKWSINYLEDSASNWAQLF